MRGRGDRLTKKVTQISRKGLHFFNLFLKRKRKGPYHIETSTLICRANQWTGSYLIGTSVMKELIIFLFFFLNDIHLSLFHFFSKMLFCICEIQQNLYMCKCFHNCVDMCP